MQTFIKFFLIFITITGLYADRYSFSLVNMAMSYTEYDDAGTFLDSEKTEGLIGFELQYSFDTGCDAQGCGNLDFTFSQFSGKTNYDGFYISSGEAVHSTTANILTNFESIYSKTNTRDNVELMFGLGVGYHTWYRELSQTQNELYSWFYLTPVVGIGSEIADGINIALKAKYKYGILPKMKANDFSEAFELGSADTFEVHLPLDIAIDEEISLNIAYVYAKQIIEKSKYYSGTVGTTYSDTWHEPASTDNQNFIKFGVTFRY